MTLKRKQDIIQEENSKRAHLEQETAVKAVEIKANVGSYEVMQSLVISNIFSLLDNKSLSQFSMMNKHWHGYLFETLCNNVTFIMISNIPLVHYIPKRLWIGFLVDLEFLPLSLTHLTFSDSFNRPVDILPPNLTHLTFGNSFNQHVDDLPSSVTHLTFGYPFNQYVDYLPAGITHLTFGFSFNLAVDQLPPSITHLTFGNCFNQQVDHLPSSITHLIFGFSFNQPVDHLPLSITHLTFGYCFSQAIDSLPASITHLTLLFYSQHQSSSSKYHPFNWMEKLSSNSSPNARDTQ